MAGCSWFGGDDDDAAIEPAELVKFDPEVKVKRQWSAKVGAGAREYFSSLRPAASAEAIFAAGFEGKVTALNVQTGKRIWSTELEAPLSGGVGYGANLVMVGTTDAEVYALNANDGSVAWSAVVSSEILSSPQSNGEVVIVQTIDNKLFALDADSGCLLYTSPSPRDLSTSRMPSSA